MSSNNLQTKCCKNVLNKDEKYVQEGIVNILKIYINSVKTGKDWIDPATLCVKEIGNRRYSVYFEFISM